ncbi:TPA_asm: hypothetical protein vir521_00003 [Caudoviricetes sp. vir521]|nr:TPA_asm: hypothetical protein vir521_00003 [Caudoviricetes sp. vir521]
MMVRTALMVGWAIFCIIVTVKIILDAILIKREVSE